jgi:hypothetical protein
MAQLMRTWQRAKPSKTPDDACPSGSLPRSADLVETLQRSSPASHFELGVRPSGLITSHQPLASATTLADDPKVGGYDLNNPVERRREYGLVR